MSLQSLIAAAGRSIPEVATAIGVPPLLLTRVDQRRQPLPMFVAERVAGTLGVARQTVVENVHQVVRDDASPDLTRLATPYPPQFGDPISALELTGPYVVDLSL